MKKDTGGVGGGVCGVRGGSGGESGSRGRDGGDERDVVHRSGLRGYGVSAGGGRVRRGGRIDADGVVRAGDDHESDREEGRERDGPDAGFDERALALPGRARADHYDGNKRVPGGVHGCDGGLNLCNTMDR